MHSYKHINFHQGPGQATPPADHKPGPYFILGDKMEKPSLVIMILFAITGLKAIIGFHFPWERCPCCGKKFKNHKR